MTLLAPWAWGLSAVGLAVVALYLLKIRRRRQTVPALDFWRQLAGQTQVRSLFQRLKRWLSMALWLLIVACLVLAAGNPVFSFGKIKPQSIAVIFDNSASMKAIEAGQNDPNRSQMRFAMAQAAVEELTSRRPVADEWLLIEAARRPRVVVPWILDPKSVVDGAKTLEPFGGAADLSAARDLAAQLLEGRERPCIVILTDGANGEASKLAASDQKVVIWPVGAGDDNLGITHLRVRTNREQASHYALCRVVNASDRHVDAQLVFEIDGSATAVESLALEADATWEKTIVFNNPAGGVLRASIDRADVLPDDNEAFAILPPIRSAVVVLVSPPGESFFFEQAMISMDPLVDAEASRTLTPDEYDAGGDAVASADLMIFNNCTPKKLPERGRFVFINDWPAEINAKSSGDIEPREMLIVARDHPLMRFVNAGGVTLAHAKRVTLTERATVLARSSDGSPLIFLDEAPDRQSVCLAFDVMESDLPFRNAFPIFLRNAVAHLVAERTPWIDSACGIGDVVASLRPLPTGVSQIEVARMRKDTSANLKLPVRQNRFVYFETNEPGPRRFTIGDEIAYTAVNLTDEGESRLRVPKGNSDVREKLALTDRLFGAVPWLALAVIALTLVGMEWMTYHYRWTE